MASKSSRTDAEARFARTQKRATVERVLNEAQSEAKRVDENTTRLRALRLDRDAKQEAAKATAPAEAPKAKPSVAKSIPVKKLNARNDG